MHPAIKQALIVTLFASPVVAAAPQSGVPQRIDLAQRLAAGSLRVEGADATPLKGERTGIHLSQKGTGSVVWIDGTDFREGTIEVEIRGRDVLQQSFVGVAFHRIDDKTYELVYLRPFNFRSEDPVRRQHAVQYVSVPEFEWPRLRKEFPEEFENPVDQAIVPTDWVALKLVVTTKAVQIFVGPGKTPALEVRRLSTQDRGMIGLWAGGTSESEFANLRVTPMK